MGVGFGSKSGAKLTVDSDFQIMYPWSYPVTQATHTTASKACMLVR